LYSSSSATHKRFREGLDHLLREGVAQLFELKNSLIRVPLLGAVGPLQFEVLKYRLESEYGAECRVEPAPWTMARWLPPNACPSAEELIIPSGSAIATDDKGCEVVLFDRTSSLRFFEEKNPHLKTAPQPWGFVREEAAA